MKTSKISHPIPANFFNPGPSDLSTPSSGIESMARSWQNVPVRRTSAGVRLPGGINGSVVAPCCSARHHSAFNVIPAFCIPATDVFQNECYVLLSYSTHSAFQRSAPHVLRASLKCKQAHRGVQVDLTFWNAECSSCGYRMEVWWNTEWRSIFS